LAAGTVSMDACCASAGIEAAFGNGASTALTSSDASCAGRRRDTAGVSDPGAAPETSGAGFFTATGLRRTAVFFIGFGSAAVSSLAMLEMSLLGIVG
jgi:hypothetical protein